MAGINKVILIGNLGADPEVRTLESGVKVAQFNIATSETYKDKDGNKQEQTEWHRLVAWRQLAEIAESYLKKGSKIYVEGKLRTRSWTNKENQVQYTTEIIADRLQMLDKREGGSGSFPPPPSEEDFHGGNTTSSAQNQAPKANEPAIPSTNEPEDDLPF
jgi:single-strand DNA-binding protein